MKQFYNALFVILLLLAGATGLFAQWSHDPNINNPICTAGDVQTNPASASDGAGGVIITWQDYRSGTNYDIYAQRIDASGVLRWTPNGVPICTIINKQYDQQIVSDGVGGAIITWFEGPEGSQDIYAQRINALGMVQWAQNGVAICTATSGKYCLRLCSDGVGGAIIMWADHRSYTTNDADIYTQRISLSGVVQWTADGVVICTATTDLCNPQLCSDDAGGAIITWRSGQISDLDIYAQRISPSGVVRWERNGVVICTLATWQTPRQLCSDGTGGAIILWTDSRSANSNIYAQRISSSGTIQWAADGVAICTTPDDQSNPQLCSDGTGGAIITWFEYRSGSGDIYARRINSSGIVQWTTDGVAICTATGGFYPEIVSDGSGGAIITWNDYRSGNSDIYAQNVDKHGYLGDASPHIQAVEDIKNDQGGKVNLMWSNSYVDEYPLQTVTSYYLYRGVKPSSMSKSDFAEISSKNLNPINNYEYFKLPLPSNISDTIYWRRIATITAEQLIGYSYDAPTLSDSGPQGNSMYYFMVRARTTDPNIYWDSQPDSGFSIDNLAPTPPLNVAGKIVGNAAVLHWNRNAEADLSHYEIYRSDKPDFDVSKMEPLTTTTDTAFSDPMMPPFINFYYALRAVDIHGNHSGKSNEAAIIFVGIGEELGIPTEFALNQNYPNPFNPSTTIHFELPKESHVTLKVYNMLGQEVLTVLDEEEVAGRYDVRIDGSTLSSSVYFYRLKANSAECEFIQTKKIILMK